VLPPVLEEGDYSTFKFWFENSIQDGMYYRNELFYRLHTAPSWSRARLFHYACRLAQHDHIVVTAAEETYSIWVSFRSPNLTASKLRKQLLPSYVCSHRGLLT